MVPPNIENIEVEVVYALYPNPITIPLSLKKGSTVEDAIIMSGILKRVGMTIEGLAGVGIFGETVLLSQSLKAGDRVEIYRPLKQDPKEARRKRALKNKIVII